MWCLEGSWDFRENLHEIENVVGYSVGGVAFWVPGPEFLLGLIELGQEIPRFPCTDGVYSLLYDLC